MRLLVIRNTRNSSRSRAPRLAYSIIEVLVAIAVLGIMFVSLYTGFSAGFALIKVARENLRATQILQEKMETIRLYTWDQVNTKDFIPDTFIENYYATSTNDVSGLRYTGTVSIASAPIKESYADEMREVTINIAWVSSGQPRRREMKTFVTRHGLQSYIY